jgi:hypothetical protein
MRKGCGQYSVLNFKQNIGLKMRNSRGVTVAGTLPWSAAERGIPQEMCLGAKLLGGAIGGAKWKSQIFGN